MCPTLKWLYPMLSAALEFLFLTSQAERYAAHVYKADQGGLIASHKPQDCFLVSTWDARSTASTVFISPPAVAVSLPKTSSVFTDILQNN